MEEDFKTDNIKQAYMQVKFQQEGHKSRTDFVRNNNEEIISEINDILNALKEYSQQLLDPNQNIDSDNSNTHRNRSDGKECEMESATLGEVQEYMESQRLNKAPGGAVIASKLLKAGGRELLRIVYQIMSKAQEKGSIPDTRREASYVLLTFSFSNYMSYKILTEILKRRLEPYSERILREYQTGFRLGRYATDTLFTFRQIIGKCWRF
jgi:hypothetical protein